jgi:unsaturated rhamnogalacturonyl hydrolase
MSHRGACVAICCFAWMASACAQTGPKATAESAARSIISRVIRETSFDFQQVPLKPSLDIHVLDFGSMYGRTTGGVSYALSVLHSKSDTVIPFGLSRDLPMTIRLNGATVFSAAAPVPFAFRELGYELFHFNDTIRLPLKKGENTLLVKAELLGRRNVVYLRELSSPGVKPSTIFGVTGLDPALAAHPWAFVGNFKTGGKKLLVHSFPPESGFKKSYAFEGADYEWRQPSAQLIQELRIKPDAAYRRESYAEWEYPNGTVMLSLLQFADAANDSAARDFVQKFCQFTVENRELFRKQFTELHAFRSTNYRLIRLGMLDDTGAPVLPFAELFLRTRDIRLESLVEDIARYVTKGQIRLPDGTLCRPERLPGTVWADDLFMSAPFLMRMGVITGDNTYFDDAAHQVLMFNKYLEDAQTGLYRHGWYDLEHRQAPVAWGRANGWVVWATSEVLRLLPLSHPLRKDIVEIYRRHLTAIVRYQAPSGLWHQVLDRPDSYEETSCTAMYLIGMARGLRAGILDASFEQPMLKAWTGLQTRISSDGIVKGICRGTEMNDDVEYYFKREQFDNDPRGLGAVITACVEMMTLQGAHGGK